MDSEAEKQITCTFTGHRAAKLPWRFDETDARCLELKERIAQAVSDAYDRGYRRFICGCADGGDLYFGEAVAELKDEREGVELIAAVPFAGQAELWAEEERERYYRLLDRCDEVHTLQESYTPSCMMNRNRFMVDRASLLIAYYTGQKGGTLNTLRYAVQQGLEVITL